MLFMLFMMIAAAVPDIDLMKFALEVNGYDIEGIDIRVRDEEICYSIETNIVSYDKGYSKRKRRR